MFCGDAFPPDPVHALGAGFEDDVRHMIRKQIDFIYIQDATVRGCEQSGLKDTHTLAERRFHVLVPATLSSLADKGTSASWGAKATDGSAPFRFFPAQEGQSHSSGASGSQCHGQPATA